MTLKRKFRSKNLNLDPKKKYTKDEVMNSYKKIMKKIHPDRSPELNNIATLVNSLLISFATLVFKVFSFKYHFIY